ncbi:MAG: hypothetical protein HZC28_03195 [Spirochaetes bacterium]|nr:hypothetical protein [Spirochaetota bacterium]
MQFSVGYQLPSDEGESFVDIITDYREHIGEVFFPWLNFATGRSSVAERHGEVDWHAQQDLEADLIAIKSMGVKLDLLINGNCYGRHSYSVYLENQIRSTIEYLSERTGGVDIVTTASPAVAFILKKHFPAVEVRASVNMRIGTVKGMQYMAKNFDSFHIQREYNRDPALIAELKTWADANGKKLVMLANSGCMNFCSGQVFHDNCVAHETEIVETLVMKDFKPHACWNYLAQDESHRVSVLQNSWVRPEDIVRYEELFDVVKLATRMHSRPRMVIAAYAEQKFHGNLLDLCEPGYGPAFAPYIIENDRIPKDWFDRVTTCDKQCHRCGYCGTVLEQALVKMVE